MKPRLINHIESITSVTLRDCCRKILDTPEFFTWPASLSFHHAYTGGLLTHTVEVCDLALGIARGNVTSCQYPAAPDILIAAALWHDFCKVREYSLHTLPHNSVTGRHLIRETNFRETTFWQNNVYQNRIHHIPGSTIEFTIAARDSGVEESVIEQVQHCILAHHGRKEWGSPVEPQTIEALLLHQADLTSARFGVTKDAPL